MKRRASAYSRGRKYVAASRKYSGLTRSSGSETDSTKMAMSSRVVIITTLKTISRFRPCSRVGVIVNGGAPVRAPRPSAQLADHVEQRHVHRDDDSADGRAEEEDHD